MTKRPFRGFLFEPQSLFLAVCALTILFKHLPAADSSRSLIPHISASPAHGQLGTKEWQCGRCPSRESLQRLPRSISAPQTHSNVFLIKGLIARLWMNSNCSAVKQGHRDCRSQDGKMRSRLFQPQSDMLKDVRRITTFCDRFPQPRAVNCYRSL